MLAERYVHFDTKSHIFHAVQGKATMNDLLAPENFSMVEPGVYRSSFPRTKNIGFLKTLKLKTVLPLVPEDYPDSMVEAYNSIGISILSHGLDGNKWPFKEIDNYQFMAALSDILLEENRPVLIHCNKGKHRTGSLVGCLRKIRGWSLTAIFAEYITFAAPKERLEDQIFVESFDIEFFKEFFVDYCKNRKCTKFIDNAVVPKITLSTYSQKPSSDSEETESEPVSV